MSDSTAWRPDSWHNRQADQQPEWRDTDALARALSEVASVPSLAVVGAGDFASGRIERLFDPDAPLPPLFRPWRLAASATGAAAIILTLASPARLDLGEQTHLNAMLTSSSLHGLPGMAAGLALNGAMFAMLTLMWRRRGRGRTTH